MKINEVSTLLTSIANEYLGETAIVKDDITGLIDIGKTFADANDYDKYTKKLIDKIGKTVIDNREYKSTAPNILKDNMEMGSILNKIRVTMPELEANTRLNLVKGNTYENFEYNPAEFNSTLYNSRNSYMIQMSYANELLKSAFTNMSDMTNLISAIENAVSKKMTISNDIIAKTAINNLITEAIYNGKYINLMTKYNTEFSITSNIPPASRMLYSSIFIQYIVSNIMNYRSYFKELSSNFNSKGYVNFTPEEKQRLVLNSLFVNSVKNYLPANTYRDVYTLGQFDEVNFWQGVGLDSTYEYDEMTKISMINSQGHDVTKTGVIGVLFDNEAVGIYNENKKITSTYSANGDFTNFFYYYDSMSVNDLGENVMVFTSSLT